MKRLIAAAALIALLSTSASADIFLQIDAISGDSVDKAHAGWIDVTTATDGLSTPTITGPGAGIGKPQFADIVIGKGLDRASVALRSAAAKGAAIKSAVIEFRNPGQGPALRLRITLQGVVISSVQGSFTATSGVETVALGYRTITWEYFPVNAAGATASPITTSATRF